MGKMQSLSDAQLLREYAESGSEEAFRELVSRQSDIVYSAALRQLNSADLARDVAQGVFIDLARKAGTLSRKLPPDASLVGWLYQSTRFAVLKLLRDEHRRESRERQAMQELQTLNSASDALPDWERIRPVLDLSMSHLSEAEREALLLRFFQNRDLRSVGAALGISEDAAQKRVSRSLTKLREAFVSQGIRADEESLGIVLSAHSVAVAPSGLAAGISNAILVSTASPTAMTAATIKTLGATVVQKGLVAVALALIAGAGVHQAARAWRLHDRVIALQQEQGILAAEIATLKSNNTSLSKPITAAQQTQASSIERLRELLRLRGEVGVLRRRQHELEETLAKARPGTRDGASQPQGNVPSPFRVQLVLDEAGENSEMLTNVANGAGGEVLQVQKSPLLDSTAIRSVSVSQDKITGRPTINVEFSPEGRDLFAAITRDNLNKRLAIILDGRVLSAPVIRSEISGGKAVIAGDFTMDQAQELAAKINNSVAQP